MIPIQKFPTLQITTSDPLPAQQSPLVLHKEGQGEILAVPHSPSPPDTETGAYESNISPTNASMTDMWHSHTDAAWH